MRADQAIKNIKAKAKPATTITAPVLLPVVRIILLYTQVAPPIAKKNAITHGKNPTAACAVTAADYGVMVLHRQFLMVLSGRCCLSFIAARIVVVSSG